MRKEINLPKEARLSFFFVFLTMCKLFTYIQISSKYQVTGGSAEQPLRDLGEKAQNQPKPHPSSKIG